MNAYIERVIEQVKRRDAHEPECGNDAGNSPESAM